MPSKSSGSSARLIIISNYSAIQEDISPHLNEKLRGDRA
jgi:hypothetical protein